MKLKPPSLLILSLLFVFRQASAQPPNKDINDKLSTITSLVVIDNSSELPADSILRNHLKIELISEEEFKAKQKTKVSHHIADTTKIRKKNGRLRLPTTTGSKTFVDKLVDDDGREEYEYLGQLPLLNAYLIRCMFWESITYKLISKKNGALISNFGAMPYISPGKKRIIAVDADPYENDAGISLFSLANTTIKDLVHVRFKNWMPATDDNMFWGADGKFYLPVQYADKFWKEDGSYNTDYLYIRVSLL